MINPVIVPAVSGPFLPSLGVLAVSVFRGHHNPGGGFAAGVMAASAVIIWALAFGRTAAMKLVPVHPRYIIGTGCSSSSSRPVCRGPRLPFLTQAFGSFHVPVAGEIELASATLFDLGVLLVVFGAIYWLVAAMSDGIALEQEHIREYRARGVYHLRKGRL